MVMMLYIAYGNDGKVVSLYYLHSFSHPPSYFTSSTTPIITPRLIIVCRPMGGGYGLWLVCICQAKGFLSALVQPLYSLQSTVLFLFNCA